MIPPYLEQLEEQVRHAAASRQYREVAPRIDAFAGSVRAYVQSLPKGDPHRAEAARRVIDLLSWSLVMLQGARASCAAELRQVVTADRYSRRNREPVVRPARFYMDA